VVHIVLFLHAKLKIQDIARYFLQKIGPVNDTITSNQIEQENMKFEASNIFITMFVIKILAGFSTKPL
jgi:hypothetical protein